MLYESELNKTMLDVLENRMSGIADIITVLAEQGYNPNKLKFIILSWSNILFNAYENIDLFSEEQINKLNNIYNKILKL